MNVAGWCRGFNRAARQRAKLPENRALFGSGDGFWPPNRHVSRASMSQQKGCVAGWTDPEMAAPALQRLVTPADTVPLLGNGTVIGIFEVVELLLLSFVLCWCFPPTQQLSLRQQVLVLVVGLPFTIQAVLFSHAPSEFIYFQF